MSSGSPALCLVSLVLHPLTFLLGLCILCLSLNAPPSMAPPTSPGAGTGRLEAPSRSASAEAELSRLLVMAFVTAAQPGPAALEPRVGVGVQIGSGRPGGLRGGGRASMSHRPGWRTAQKGLAGAQELCLEETAALPLSLQSWGHF